MAPDSSTTAATPSKPPGRSGIRSSPPDAAGSTGEERRSADDVHGSVGSGERSRVGPGGRSPPRVLPKNPRDSLGSSPKRRIKLGASGGHERSNSGTSPIPLVHSASSPLPSATPHALTHYAPLDSDEQFMFEQRLTRDELGVAIRKINHSGKAQLRYVRCVPLRPVSSSDYGKEEAPLPFALADERSHRGDVSVSSRSTSSSRFIERIRSNMFGETIPAKARAGQGDDNLLLEEETNLRALTWGKKNTVTIPLSHFVAVKKGKTTDRTLRNASPSNRLLSIATRTGRGCLDIEAPTRLDRDKFATAFSVFLGVPLQEERVVEMRSVGESFAKKKLKTPSISRPKKKQPSAARSEPGLPTNSTSSTPKVRNRSIAAPEEDTSNILPLLTPSSDKASDTDKELAFFNEAKHTATGAKKSAAATPGTASMGETMSASARKRILSVDTKSESMLDPPKKDAQDPRLEKNKTDDDDASRVSSLTGAADQEIVEELHQAIIELRAELDASRAEAARAVKVAEQAIQSAENCSSSDWNSTVTHKAAEAAALAQKKSAEAIARARMAEERLSAERKSTAFWRRQAQAAEEEAGSLKTRSAAAEIQQSVMVEELASEKRRAARMFASLKEEFGRGEERRAKELEGARERKRELEVEVERLRGELGRKEGEIRRIQEEQERKEKEKNKPNRMRPSFTSRRKRATSAASVDESSVVDDAAVAARRKDQAIKDNAVTLSSGVASLRKQFSLLNHTAKEEFALLKSQSEEWSNQAGRAISASLAETTHLREKLAAESAMRLKLLNELQDIRGTVRVYCRPKPAVENNSILTIPTHDILVLNEKDSPKSFKFDRVFSPHASQYEVFSELEEPLISSLDGFNVTLLAFGQHGSGKTHSVLGHCGMDSDGQLCLDAHGVQLQALQQLFNIAGHRTDRYKDAFSMTILEVHNEKLHDLLVGTPYADEHGQVVICETRDKRDRRKHSERMETWQQGKLEIRTNIDGNTVVQGLVSIPVESFEDATTVWRETISKRAERLKQSGLDAKNHEKNSNIITTFHITSVNIATGVGTEGRLQFVDMAASDIAHGVKKMEDAVTTSEDNIHFCNKSIDALNDVVNARCQFDRSVPYRNSTLTHLLRDSLEADAKVLLLCCVSSDPSNLSDTIGTLRFGTRMQKVSIGKATKHIVGSKE